MKLVLTLFSFFLMNCNKSASPAAATGDPSYVAGVSFNSICCGPPSDDFLKSFVVKFNTDNDVKLTADKIGGCGREGEFVVLFRLGKIKEATSKKFIAEIEKLIPAQEAENKKTNTSSGGLEVLHNVKGSDYSHCRVKSQNWVY